MLIQQNQVDGLGRNEGWVCKRFQTAYRAAGLIKSTDDVISLTSTHKGTILQIDRGLNVDACGLLDGTQENFLLNFAPPRLPHFWTADGHVGRRSQ